MTTNITPNNQQIPFKRENLFRKESGYSFGVTVQQQNHIQTGRTLLAFDNSKRVVINNIQ